MTESTITLLPGTVIDEVDSYPARRFGIDPIHRGVLIVSVRPGSAVATAGLRSGDVVEEINGKKIASVFDFKHQLEMSTQPLRLLVNRSGVSLVKVLPRK